MYVFGGEVGDGKRVNDLWRLDLSTFVWSEIKSNGGKVPKVICKL
jgi:hypothetical protein